MRLHRRLIAPQPIGGRVGLTLAELATVVRYCLVGGVVAVVYVALSIALAALLHVEKQAASASAFAAAAVVSYLGHHGVTFGAQGGHTVYAPRFAAVQVCGFAASYAIIHVLVGQRWTSYAVAVVLVALTVPMISYICNRLLVFQPTTWRERGAPAKEAAIPPER